jgi:transposase InsO family protein
MVKDKERGMRVVDIAYKHEVSRKTVYRWLNRYNELGKDGLLDRSHRPKSPHPKTVKTKVVKLIVRIRKETKYGPIRIKNELFKQGIDTSCHGIYNVLIREDLIESRRRRKAKPKRYYVKEPGHLQVDTKHLDTLPGRPYRYYQYTAIDAFTRIRVLRIYDELSAYNMARFLKGVVDKLPFRVYSARTDNGIEFTYGPFKKEHPFSLVCARLGVKHYLNKPAHPESNGRVERSHRTDDEEFYRVNPVKDPKQWQAKISDWEFYYNNLRPHMALGSLSPYQYWQRYQKQQDKETFKNVA